MLLSKTYCTTSLGNKKTQKATLVFSRLRILVILSTILAVILFAFFSYGQVSNQREVVTFDLTDQDNDCEFCEDGETCASCEDDTFTTIGSAEGVPMQDNQMTTNNFDNGQFNDGQGDMGGTLNSVAGGVQSGGMQGSALSGL